MRGAAALLLSSPYYYLRLALALGYWPLRALWLRDSALDLPASFGLTREQLIVFAFAAYLVANHRRFWTAEHFLCRFLLYANLCVAVLLGVAGAPRPLAVHALACLALWTQLPRPARASPLLALAEGEFNALLGGEGAGPRGYSFVVFHASFADTCLHTEGLWARFARAYGGPRLLFCAVDVGRWPALARRMHINVSGLSRQLPTAVLFRDCEELRRFPPIAADGRVGKVLGFDAAKLEAYFELPALFMRLQTGVN